MSISTRTLVTHTRVRKLRKNLQGSVESPCLRYRPLARTLAHKCSYTLAHSNHKMTLVPSVQSHDSGMNSELNLVFSHKQDAFKLHVVGLFCCISEYQFICMEVVVSETSMSQSPHHTLSVFIIWYYRL